MGAIRPHKTAVDKSGSWDGPAAVADAPNDAEVLRYMHAWVDENGDPEAKQSYKFPHHRPGTDTPAVIAAVNNALARLPQAAIPDADRAGVERHLRKHREDAGLENDDLGSPFLEQRTFATRELRIAPRGDDGNRYIEGYAAVFNQWSEDLGGFIERILPGAFAEALQGADVRALINHDANLVLGRTTAGTLELSEDEVGLRVRIRLPDTQYARDLIATMERGDVDQMSFGFSVAENGDRWFEEHGMTKREIMKVGRLFDVSVVTFPAYPQTAALARDVLHQRYCSGDEPIQAEGAPEEEAEAEAARASLALKRRRLDLYEKSGG